MPIVPAIVDVVVSVGVSEMGIGAVVEGVVGQGMLADVITGSLIGGVSSGLTGGDIEKGMIAGGIGGGVSSAYGSSSVPDEMGQFGKTEYPGAAPDLTTGQMVSKGLQDAGVSQGVSEAASKGLGKFAAGTAAGLGTGQDLKTAAERGLFSGVSGATKDFLFPTDPNAQMGEGPSLTDTVGKGLVDVGLSSLFSSSKGGTGATSYTPQTSVATTGAGSTPGSEALAQALRLDPGAPVFGGEKEKGKESGWNVESLRYMGNSEA